MLFGHLCLLFLLSLFPYLEHWYCVSAWIPLASMSASDSTFCLLLGLSAVPESAAVFCCCVVIVFCTGAGAFALGGADDANESMSMGGGTWIGVTILLAFGLCFALDGGAFGVLFAVCFCFCALRIDFRVFTDFLWNAPQHHLITHIFVSLR